MGRSLGLRLPAAWNERLVFVVQRCMGLLGITSTVALVEQLVCFLSSWAEGEEGRGHPQCMGLSHSDGIAFLGFVLRLSCRLEGD